MRYNVDTGSLNPNGGVSYAGVELIDQQESLITLGVGLSTYSMEERIQRWGIIIPGPLEDIPWTSRINDGVRVTPQREMREALLSLNGFYTIGQYEKELTRRFFSNEEIFQETCRFLSMGKAYREIAASTADYHQLFKTLLPAPKTDLFDRIIEALRSLDEANLLLEEMENKFNYLQSLEQLIASITAQRESICRYEWLKLHFAQAELRDLIAAGGVKAEEIAAALEKSSRSIDACILEQQSVDRRIADLRTADGAGLIRQEKDVHTDLKLQEQRLLEYTDSVARYRLQQQQATQKEQAARKKFYTGGTALIQAGTEAVALEAVDSLQGIATLRQIMQSAAAPPAPGDALAPDWNLRISALQQSLEATVQGRRREHDRLADRLTALQDQRSSAENERRELSRAFSLRPAVAGLAEALKHLHDRGIRGRLLYEMLEWNAALDVQSRSAVEECIGADVLAVILVTHEEYESARQIVFETHSGLRIHEIRYGNVEAPQWVRIAFDLLHSDPGAIGCLVREMIAEQEPGVCEINGFRTLSFRSHQRRLDGAFPQWIGQEERKQALQLRLSLLDDTIEAFNREWTQITAAAAALQDRIESLETVKNRITQAMHDFAASESALAQARQEIRFRSEALLQEENHLRECSVEVQRLSERRDVLNELIRREGLADLDQRMTREQERRSILDEQYKTLLREEGALRQSAETLRLERIQHEQRLAELAVRQEKTQELLRSMIDAKIDDIPYYVLRTNKGAQFKSIDAIDAEIRESQRSEASNLATLKERLRDPNFGARFGFHYDEDRNVLVDRRDRLIADMTAAERLAIDEQQQVINEKSAELFKKIIVNEMVAFFARHLSRLEQMVRTINAYLGQRTFGSIRYRLELQKEESYSGFIETVKRFSPFAPGSEEALKQFIDDHRDQIINAEVDTVPDVLDYRNWYTYNLRMTTDDGTGIVMDRKTKSVGSGGEQAVPNYLTILTIARFLFEGNAIRIFTLLFDEAFYGIDAGRRDQLLGFATDLGLQLMVASPEQDGVRREVRHSTTILVVKDSAYDVHLYPFHWESAEEPQMNLFENPDPSVKPVTFGDELESENA